MAAHWYHTNTVTGATTRTVLPTPMVVLRGPDPYGAPVGTVEGKAFSAEGARNEVGVSNILKTLQHEVEDTSAGINFAIPTFNIYPQPEVKQPPQLEMKNAPPLPNIGTVFVPAKRATKPDAWLRTVTADLNTYSMTALKAALPETKSIHKRDLVYALIKNIQEGRKVALKPPLNYLRHYVGNLMGEERRPILTKLLDKELAFIAIRMGIVEVLKIGLITRDTLINMLVNYVHILSSDELQELSTEQLKTLMHNENIPLNVQGARANSPSHLCQVYAEYYKTLGGYSLPKKHYVPDMSSLLIVPGMFTNVTTRTRPIKYQAKDVCEAGVLAAVAANFVAIGTTFFEQVDLIPMDELKITNNVDLCNMIRNHQYLHRPGMSPVYAIEYFINKPERELDELLTGLGLPHLAGNWEEKLQILWLLYITDRPLKAGAELFATCSTEELSRNLPATIVIPKDRASLLWWWMTNTYPPSNPVVDTPRYQQVIARSGTYVMCCCKYLYRYYGDILHDQNPYRFLALITNISPMEPFIEAVESHSPPNIVRGAAEFMMIPPTLKESGAVMQYYLENLQHYAKVFTRTLRPVTFYAGSLGASTDAELMMHFQFTGLQWQSRPHLLTQLETLMTSSTLQWTLLCNPVRCCNPKLNTFTLVERDFTDANDPIISYGNIYGYRCYSTSELVATFTAIDDSKDGLVHFYNPIYNNPKTSTPGDYVDTLREFDTKSMKQLRAMLVGCSHKPDLFNELIAAIDRGISDASKIGAYTAPIRLIYTTMTSGDMQAFDEVVMQMFTMGMYARFWKGPGYPYPFKWVEDGAGSDEKHPMLEPIWRRDENYTKANMNLVATLATSSEAVRKLYNSLHIINYIWSSGTAYLTQALYAKVAEDAARTTDSHAQMCLADMSDRGLQTAYFTMVHILGWDDIKINTKLRTYMRCSIQNAFYPSIMGSTTHIDPNHRPVIIKD